MSAKNSPPAVIVALDVPDSKQALELVDKLAGLPAMYKVGLELFAGGDGASLTRQLVQRGLHVFADLKLLDIPATVSRAAKQISDLGATYLTVHAEQQALQAAVAGSGGATAILAVTFLTSMTVADLRARGYRGSVDEYVAERAAQAAQADCAGVVCSPLEIAAVRAAAGPDLLVVTPGISSGRTEGDDQARTAGIAEALAAGASHVVVGRAVRDADDPRAALTRLLDQAGLL